MEMYENLVKRLRESCRDCKLWDGNECCLDGDCTGRVRLQAADAIEELLRKEKFHAFLWNAINPNDMQLYLEMYHSGDEKENAE